MFRSFARVLAGACVSLVVAAHAAEPPGAAEGPTLTLRTAVEQALARNPELQNFSFRLQAQRARSDVAGLKPPLELRAELENVLGTGRTRGVDAAEATLALSRVVELGGKRERRLEAAAAEFDLIETEARAAQLDVLAEVTRRFVHVVSDQEQLTLTRHVTELAQQSLKASELRVTAAKAPEAELRRARVAAMRARVDEEHAEHELLSSRRRLAAVWGDTDARFAQASADFYVLPEVGSFEALLDRLDDNPDFLRFASEARLRDAEIRLAETKARSDLTLSLGVRQLQATHDQALVFGLAMPLQSKARAQGAVAEARALRARTDAERDAQRIRTQAQLFELHQELRHAVTEASVLRAEVIPEMEAALQAAQYAYERGRYSYLEWMDAQRELVTAQRAVIEACADAHLHRAEIERLTGVPLITD